MGLFKQILILGLGLSSAAFAREPLGERRDGPALEPEYSVDGVPVSKLVHDLTGLEENQNIKMSFEIDQSQCQFSSQDFFARLNYVVKGTATQSVRAIQVLDLTLTNSKSKVPIDFEFHENNLHYVMEPIIARHKLHGNYFGRLQVALEEVGYFDFFNGTTVSVLELPSFDRKSTLTNVMDASSTQFYTGSYDPKYSCLAMELKSVTMTKHQDISLPSVADSSWNRR